MGVGGRRWTIRGRPLNNYTWTIRGRPLNNYTSSIIRSLSKITIVLIVISAQVNLYWYLRSAIGQSMLYSLKTQAHASSYRM